MALHIVRSLGQAFDVCHQLNPRPKKNKKESEEKEGEEEGGEAAKKEDGEEAREATAEGTKASEEEEGAAAKMQKLGGVQPPDKTDPALHKDLMGLDFDPFDFSSQIPGASVPNGAPQMIFDSNFASGFGSPTGSAVPAAPVSAFPPLLVSNTASGLPSLPEASDRRGVAASGRPRPRPVTSNQVGGSEERREGVIHGCVCV